MLSLKEDHLFELRRLKEDYELEKSLLETEKNKRIREIENELGVEKKRHVEDNTEWAIRFDMQKKENEDAINELLRKKKEELEEKENDFSAFIDKLKKNHAQEIQQLEKKKNDEKQEAMKELLDRKNIELEESKKLYEKKYQRLSKSFDSQMVEKTKEFDAKLQAKEERFQAEFKAHQDTRNEFLKFKDQSESKIKNLEEMVKNMRRFQQGLDEQINELKEEIVRNRTQHENQLEVVENEKAKVKKDYHEKEVTNKFQ